VARCQPERAVGEAGDDVDVVGEDDGERASG
jgi:hypothetical protein